MCIFFADSDELFIQLHLNLVPTMLIEYVSYYKSFCLTCTTLVNPHSDKTTLFVALFRARVLP